MSGFSGRKLLVKRGSGTSPETFTTIAGAREHTITENENLVDTTNKDSLGNRELLAGKVLYNVSVAFTGVFLDSTTLSGLETAMRAGTHSNYQIDIVSSDATNSGETLTGAFRITKIERAGAFDGEVNYNVTLESDGAVTSA